MLRPYHLCHLEALNTLERVTAGEPILLNNSVDPKYTVAAVAKRPIRAGSVIRKGAGGFDVRGLAVPLADHRNAVPVCLLRDTVVIRNIEPGQVVRFDDVVMPESQALTCYRSIAEQPRQLSRKSKLFSEHTFFLGMMEFANGWPLHLAALA